MKLDKCCAQKHLYISLLPSQSHKVTIHPTIVKGQRNLLNTLNQAQDVHNLHQSSENTIKFAITSIETP
jgi:hypothetical protein